MVEIIIKNIKCCLKYGVIVIYMLLMGVYIGIIIFGNNLVILLMLNVLIF